MKRITKQGLLSLGALTLFFSASSFAQSSTNESPEQTKTVAEIFKEMDLNEDNQLSKDETKEPFKKDFEKIDLNKNGFISPEELKKSLNPEVSTPPEK